ncbi:MAG: serine/threonine protein kinase, partial [Roseburia sp.]|nr:serine/threonine protein kinase [Roseburia sp.]
MIQINNRTLCEYCFEETDREPCPHCGYSREAYVKDPTVLAVGNILENRYIVGGVIGKGGFGITYLAYDRKLERKVAVKEYYPYGLAMRNLGSTFVSTVSVESVDVFKGGADKFYDEARLVAKFNDNPNIVSVYDFFYGNDTVYFTMGFLKGQTLKSYIRDHGVLTAGQTVRVAMDVTNALLAAHHLNVLHRDISPDNIMVCSDGTIKLLDFGAARQVLTEGSQSLSVILKQGFAPLEQYQKKGKQGPWTDIYALGATLYYALTLDLLDDPMSRLEDDSEYSSNVHNIDAPLWEIIRKATMLKSSERYRDIGELREALEALPIRPEPLSVSEENADKIKFEPLSRTAAHSTDGRGAAPHMAETVGYAEAGGAT